MKFIATGCALVGLAGMVACTVACTSPLPLPRASDAARSNVSVQRLADGRDLYAAKCSSCHAPFAPSHRPARVWPQQVDQMARRAHLSRPERDLIVAYLTAVAGGS